MSQTQVMQWLDKSVESSQCSKRYIEITKSKVAKTLVPQGFFVHRKIAVVSRNELFNLVPLDQVTQFLVVGLTMGYKDCAPIVALLAGLSLHQLFCDAFDIEFNKIDRLEWLKARQEGKSVRRTLTDAIKDYLETTETTEEYRKWVYANATELVNLGVFRRRANQLRKDWGCKNPRDKMTSDELRWVLQVEELAMRLIDRDKIEPLNAVREAVSRLCIEVVKR